jgi:hypothetical protein
MAAPNSSGGYYGTDGWAPAGHIPPQTPTRMHPLLPAQQVYNTPQQAQYNQWASAAPQTTPQGIRYPHHAASGHHAVTHSPVPYSQHQQQPVPQGPDMPTVLLSLADTYITTAHVNGYKSVQGSDSQVKAYCKLVATGLGCLEMALQVFCGDGGVLVQGDVDGRLVPASAAHRGDDTVTACEYFVRGNRQPRRGRGIVK